MEAEIQNNSKVKFSEEITKLIVPVEPVEPTGFFSDNGALETALVSLGAIPSHEEVNRREETLNKLRQILLNDQPQSTRQLPRLVLVPIGAYGLGVWTSAHGIDCLGIGVYLPKTFFALATELLRSNDSLACTVRRMYTSSGDTVLLVDVDGLRFRIGYCQAASVAEQWPEFLTEVPELSPKILAKLKAFRDVHYLCQSFPADSPFCVAHRAVQAWACARGIYSACLGYLDDMQIAVLLARVIKLMPTGRDGSVPHILATFFRHYVAFNWTESMAFDPFFHHDKVPHIRTDREPLVVLGYHRPQLNLSRAATTASTDVLAAEFWRSDRVLSSGQTSWEGFLSGNSEAEVPGAGCLPSGAADFIEAYSAFVKIDLQYWSLSPHRSTAFLDWLASHSLFILLANLTRRLPGLRARIWPGLFCEEAADANVSECRGFYLVGVDAVAETSSEDQATLQSALAAFERQVHGSVSYDVQRMWLGTSIVDRSSLGDVSRLHMDTRPWRGDDSDEEEEEEDADTKEETKEDMKKTKKSKESSKTKSGAAQDEPAARRFPSAQEMINRLRWDPSLDHSDFIVGYEDRFSGVRERPLDIWRSEQTEEEFIPQHRILYFSRRNGIVVWDRRARQTIW